MNNDLEEYGMMVARETLVADTNLRITLIMQRVSQAYPSARISRHDVERWIAQRPLDFDKGEMVCAIASDLHFGKESDTFNPNVAETRLKLYFSALAKLAQTPTATFHILLVGDCVEGEGIYPGQAHAARGSVREQAQHCADVLKTCIAEILHDRPLSRVRVHSVIGNHGRMSKEANTFSNWDAVVTDLVKQWAEGGSWGDRLVVYPVPNSERQLIEVGGVKILMNHHGTKHLGTPAMRTKWMGWLRRYNFDLAVHGHWHTPALNCLEGSWVLSNGSLSGADDLSDSMGTYQPAHQGYAVIRSGHMQIGFVKLE